MILNSPYITGSITVTGNANVQGTLTVTGSLSGTATSASLALNSNLLQGTGSVGFSTTASLLAVSSSQQQISASLLNVIANYATTGSNSFRADQSITGSLVVSSTITAQTLVVQTVTSSIVYSSGSNIFGNALTDRQTFTGSIQASGSSSHFLMGGSVGIGITNPTRPLQINAAADTRIVITDSNVSTTAGLYIRQFGSASAIVNNSNGTFQLATNDTYFLTANASGQVGIGTTQPSYTLDVAGTGRFTGAATFSGSVTLTSGYIETPWANETRTVWERYTNATYFQRISSNGAARQLRLESNGAYGNASIVLDGQGNTTTSTIITSDNSIFTGAVSLNTGNSLRLYRPDSSFPSTSWYWNIYMDSSNLLSFAINGGTPKMIINASGNVGIGTTSVNSEKLTINQTTGNASALYVYTTDVTTGQSYGLTVVAGTNSSDRSFAVFSQSSTEYLKVRGDGYLFSTPTYNNQWPGTSPNMYVASDGSFGRTTPSSGRYKENINEWSGSGLNTILALKPKTFKYKKDYCNSPDNIDFLGLIAEEVAEVSPYLAQYENLDRTGLVENVRYDTIVVPLIKAIQELKATNDDLQAQINELKER